MSAIAIGFVMVVFVAGPLGAAAVGAPPYRHAPEGPIYGGSPPSGYPAPYQYDPALWPYLGGYGGWWSDPYGGQLIPAGRLILRVEPSEAEVSVDGLRLARREDDSYQIGVLVGAHRVSIRAEGYEPYDGVVDVAAGQGINLTVTLKGRDH